MTTEEGPARDSPAMLDGERVQKSFPQEDAREHGHNAWKHERAPAETDRPYPAPLEERSSADPQPTLSTISAIAAFVPAGRRWSPAEALDGCRGGVPALPERS